VLLVSVQRARVRKVGGELLLRGDLKEDVAASGKVRDVAALRAARGRGREGQCARSRGSLDERKERATHRSQRARNLLARLDPPELDEAVAGLAQRAADDGGCLGLALGAHDGRLALLLGLWACKRGISRRSNVEEEEGGEEEERGERGKAGNERERDAPARQ